MPEEFVVLISGTVVLLTLALGIIAVIIFQQRKVYNIQQRNLEKLAESEKRYRRLVKLSPLSTTPSSSCSARPPKRNC
jgi:hypothetical protein